MHIDHRPLLCFVILTPMPYTSGFGINFDDVFHSSVQLIGSERDVSLEFDISRNGNEVRRAKEMSDDRTWSRKG